MLSDALGLIFGVAQAPKHPKHLPLMTREQFGIQQHLQRYGHPYQPQDYSSASACLGPGYYERKLAESMGAMMPKQERQSWTCKYCGCKRPVEAWGCEGCGAQRI